MRDGGVVGLQVGGQEPRWQLYHQLYLIEHSGKRMTPVVKGIATNSENKRPPSPPPLKQDHPLNDHIDWMLPTLLRICACLHALWTPQVCLANVCDMHCRNSTN